MFIDSDEVREIIRRELPQLIKSDPYVRELAKQLSQLEAEDPTPPEQSKEIDTKLETKFSLIVNQFKRETSAQMKRLDENNQEMQVLRREIHKTMEDIERIHRLLDVFDRTQEISLGDLKFNWGY